jgi:hypothetical protein
MRVKAAPGLKCPKDGRPREYVEDKEFVEVPDSAYYLRLVADGSLIEDATTGIDSNNEKGGTE